VGFDLRVFRLGQGAGLPEYLGRYCHLADVVDDRGQTKHRELPSAQAEFGPDGDSEIRHAFLVPDGQWILTGLSRRERGDASMH